MRRAFALAGGACVVYALAVVIHAVDGGRSGVPGPAEVVLSATVQLTAAALCLARARRDPRDRAAWSWLGAGMLVWTLGAGVLLVVTAVLGHDPQVPTVADPFYLAFYPCVYVGLVLLMRARSGSFLSASWLDGMVAALGFASLAAALAFRPFLRVHADRPLTVAVMLAYPIGDLVLVGLAVTMVALAWRRGARRWWLLAAGCLVFVAADGGYLFASSHGAWVAGSVPAAGWPTGMLLMSMAAWQRPGRRVQVRLDGAVALSVPLAGGAIAVVVLAAATPLRLGPVALGLATGAVVTFSTRMLVSIRDLRELARAREQAVTDDLTGLGNRRLLEQRLAEAMAEARAATAAGRVGGSLLLVDLDRFKEVNDSLGHPAGNLLLRMVGPRIQAAVGESDALVRLGGDEFAVVLRAASEVESVAAAQRILRELDRVFVLSEASVHVTGSIGIASFPADAGDTAGLLRCADLAMYKAKRARAGYRVYDPSQDDARERLVLVEELRRGIDEGAFRLHYQPQLRLADGICPSVEALVRWPGQGRVVVSPEVFIPLAEETGLIHPLTLQVVEMAVAQCAAWHRDGQPIGVSVNLSATDLLDARLPARLRLLLGRVGLHPSALTVEITESALLVDPVRAQEIAHELVEVGVAISIDDFGTGYSSLAYLRSLPASEVKLDRSFVTGLGSQENWRDAAIVRSTIDLGHALGMRVVAEGVEDGAALEVLDRFGCDLVQGYAIGRPVPAGELDLTRTSSSMPDQRGEALPWP